MIDLPDYGYVDYTLSVIDPAGVVEGALGGPSDIIDRPGLRYSVQFTLPALAPAAARAFQAMLERGARSDVSYPFPLDVQASAAGSPLINGDSAAGSVIPIKGLPAGYTFAQGQTIAVVSGGIRFIHKAVLATTASGSGTVTLPVFPYTRKTFSNGDVVEVVNPRIGGVLSWQGAQQGPFGARPFSFAITERY